MTSKKSATIVIPAFNEGENLSITVKKVIQGDPFRETIVVDDGSSDDSGETVLSFGAGVIRLPDNLGTGAAIKTGIRAAKGDILVFLDADGQHDPDDIPLLLAYMDQYDMVVGARRQDQQASRARGWMNRIYSGMASYVTGFKVADLTSGFRAIRAETARDLLPLLPNGYSWPTTMTLVLLRSGMRVKYVPVNVKPRRLGRSRIKPVRDGIRFFMIIMKICTLYSPFRIFLPVAGGMFALGLVNYAYTFFSSGRFTNMSALLFTSAVIIFMIGLVSEQISQISLLRQHVRPKTADEASLDPDGADGKVTRIES